MTDCTVKPLNKEDAERYASDAAGLYRQAGWIGAEDPDSVLVPILRNSWCVMGAFDRTGSLIGMMRALSDGVSDAYLLDMVVDEAFRGRGIARRILKELTAVLKKNGVDWIVCISVPEAETLYAGQGEIMRKHIPFRFR